MSKIKIPLYASYTLLLLSCGGGSSDTITGPGGATTQTVAQVQVSASATSLHVGKTLTLTAQALDATGATVSNKSFAWSSSATSIATVGADGLVTGIAVGPAKITATVDGKAGTYDLTVIPIPVASVTATVSTSSLQVGQTTSATVTLKDANGIVLTDRSIQWSSQSVAIATVSTTGTVMGVAPGIVSIVATSEGVNGTASITVVPVPAGPPSFIEKVRGDVQSAVVNTAVALAPTVRVTDAVGRPASGAPVTFTVQSGNGSLSPSVPLIVGVVNTDAEGVASVGSWKLGPLAGVQTLSASIGNGQSVSFSATALAAGASILQKVAGDGQTAVVKTSVPVVPTVKLTDANGNPVEGREVSFTVVSGDGTLGTAVKTTDASGTASVGSWVLGQYPGAQSISATAGGVAGIVFTATALPGPAATITVFAGDQQSPTVTTTSAPVVFEVKDAFGNFVNIGTKVLFTITGGTLEPNSALTDVNGRVQLFWKAPTIVGGYDGVATVENTTVSVKFTLFATGANSRIYLFQGNNQRTFVGTALPVSPAVQVKDQYGNPTPLAIVRFNISGGVGTISSSTATTDANGIARVTWTLNQAGPNKLKVYYENTPTDIVEFTATGDFPPIKSWTKSFTFTGSNSSPVAGIWGSNSTDVFAISGSQIAHFNGSQWEMMTTPVASTVFLRSISGTSSTNVYAVGGTNVYHYNGNAWTVLPAITNSQLNDVWAASPTKIYIAGAKGALYRYNGSGWVNETSDTTRSIYSVWAPSSGNVVYTAGALADGSGFISPGDIQISKFQRPQPQRPASRVRGVNNFVCAVGGGFFVACTRLGTVGWSGSSSYQGTGYYPLWLNDEFDGYLGYVDETAGLKANPASGIQRGWGETTPGTAKFLVLNAEGLASVNIGAIWGAGPTAELFIAETNSVWIGKR